MALITCREVALGYEGRTVTEHLNFSVHAGDYLCVIGENGSGKSTLIKALLRLKTPLSGEIVIGDGLQANEIGYLSQQTVIQRDFPASVREIVQSGCVGKMGLRPFYSRKERQRADEMMQKLGIAELADRCYRELSGGQQQRALLARALCATGKLLLLDEPAAGLDPAATQELYERIAELNRKDGITVIMVTHDLEMAMRDSTHILHVGYEPKFFGKTEEYRLSGVGAAYLAAAPNRNTP